jgi:ArsR family transcriptional regulator, virulence genes transcriptional regulator
MKNNPAVDTELVLDEEKVKRTALMLRALNNKLRFKIIKFIHDRERINVTEIYKKLRLEQSVTSQHLAILRRANFVITEREGRTIYYSVNYQLLKYLDKQMDGLLSKTK